jgi:hypothetical protein
MRCTQSSTEALTKGVNAALWCVDSCERVSHCCCRLDTRGRKVSRPYKLQPRLRVAASECLAPYCQAGGTSRAAQRFDCAEGRGVHCERVSSWCIRFERCRRLSLGDCKAGSCASMCGHCCYHNLTCDQCLVALPPNIQAVLKACTHTEKNRFVIEAVAA